MQRVIHAYINQSRIFNMLEGIHAYISDTTEEFDDVLWLDDSFEDLCDILESNLFIFYRPLLKHFDLPEIEHKPITEDNKEIVVLLSGGKDSAAVAYYYKKLGYKVHLYHATGINKAYGDEKKAAERVAEYLGCDLYIDKLNANGTHQYIEHPLKNYAIANGAIHYALKNDIPPLIATGNFNQSRLDLNPFEVCAGDCIEMWQAYEKIVKRVIPDFRVEVPFDTNAKTFETLKEDWELFGLTVSCMTPFRFREITKHNVEQKYGVRLFDNRCGSCWKCAVEYVWLMDTGAMEYNEGFYEHCLGVFINTIHKEFNRKASLQEAWDNYMFYPIEGTYAEKYLVGYRPTYNWKAARFIKIKEKK